MDAIETQVERLLPEGASKSARNRVVGEIYRELDATLGANRQLSQQVRDAFRSGALDANHQRAIVSLITGRARQALPGVAKRVMNEWTSTIVAANQDRRARQHAAERRVDIAGSSGGGEGRRSMAPARYRLRAHVRRRHFEFVARFPLRQRSGSKEQRQNPDPCKPKGRAPGKPPHLAQILPLRVPGGQHCSAGVSPAPLPFLACSR